MKKTQLFAALAGLACLALSGAASAAGRLDEIKARGTLIVGVKADYGAYGMKDDAGNIVGMEPDLARDVADRLGVKLELVPVISANRMEFVRQGKTDLMIATMSFKKERAEVVGIPDTMYYAGAETALAKKGSGLSQWSDIKGRPVCGVQGAYYNADVQKEGGRVVPMKDTEAALTALREGKCDAFAFDLTFFASLLKKPEWADYELALPQINPEPWAVAVKKEDEEFIKYMNDVVIDWHRKGTLIELEKKWGLPPSAFLKEMHEKYKS